MMTHRQVLFRELARRGGRVVPCRSCGAAMVWTRTERGARMPLSVASIEERGGRQYAVPHWIDCPKRDRHRRKA